MHRFYIYTELRKGPFMITDEQVVYQMRTVLRMRANDEVLLFSPVPAGWDFRFRIERITDRAADGEIVEQIKNDREPRMTVTLFQSLLKKDLMEWIFEKGTEVGVARFAPMVTERSIKRAFQMGRAEKIIKEAAEQSGRGMIPEITDPYPFEETIAYAKRYGGLAILAHEKEIRRTLDVAPPTNRHASLFIGPEGGFSEKEVSMARDAGFFITSLSRRVLRAETAAIVGSYAVLHRFGN